MCLLAAMIPAVFSPACSSDDDGPTPEPLTITLSDIEGNMNGIDRIDLSLGDIGNHESYQTFRTHTLSSGDIVFELPGNIPSLYLHEFQELGGVTVSDPNLRLCSVRFDPKSNTILAGTIYYLYYGVTASYFQYWIWSDRDATVSGAYSPVADYSETYDLDLKHGWNKVIVELSGAAHYKFRMGEGDGNYSWQILTF